MAMEENIDQKRKALEAQISKLQAELAELGGKKEDASPCSLDNYYNTDIQEATFFKMLFDSAQSSVFLVSESGVIISANPYALDFFGVSINTLDGEDIIRLFQQLKLELDPIKQALKEKGDGVSYTSWGIHPSGKEITYQMILRRLASASQPLFICICTEKQTVDYLDQVVKHSLSRLQDALQPARTFAVTIDQNKVINYCNSFLLEITGWDKSDLLGKSLLSVFTPFTANEEFVKVKGFLDTFEGVLKTKNGRELTVRFNSIVMNDQKGGIAAMTIVGEDITEQVRMSKALQQNNHLLQEVFNSTSDLILIFRRHGRLLYTNRACREVLGYQEGELDQMKIRDLINPNYYEDTYEKLHTAMEKGSYTNFETVFISKRGQKLHLLGEIVCDYNEAGEPDTIRAILHDYTDRLKAKKSQEVYYRLARLVEKGTPLEDLYEQTHLALKQIMSIDSMIIAVQEAPDRPINVPFHISSPYGPEDERIQCLSLAKFGLTLRQPTILAEQGLHELIDQEEISAPTIIPKVWLAVPLILRQQTVGVLVVQSFKYKQDHNEKDLDLLSFISGQLTSAIVREQNEAKIHRQAGRLAAIFESGRHLMWSVNRRGQLTQFNKQFSEAMLTHYKAKAAEGVIYKGFYAPEPNPPLQFWLGHYQEVFNGYAKRLTVNFVDDNAVEHWYEVSLNPIIEPSGRVAEVSAVADDITQKKIIELDLSESEEKFRSIFESFQDVYFRTDMEGIINMVSPSVYDLMGEVQSQVVGKSVTEYYLSQSKLQFLQKVLLEEGSVKNFESTLIDKQHRTKIIISNFRLIYGMDGSPQFIEGVARDITELKKATEELRKAKNLAEKSLEVKKRFLSNMSHEIRTPMNGIIGMIDLLSDSSLNKEQLYYVNTIKKSSETLLTILNDILDLSKLEAGKMRIRKAPTALYRTVDKLQTLFAQRAYTKGTTLRYKIASEVPEFIITDETRLLQILSNLTSNAIKFTEHGNVDIDVSVLRFNPSSSNCEIHFAIKDTGIGISAENLDLLFRQFSQVDNSYTKSHGGTGLGLAISQELSRMMGGQIGVSSEMGRGSTFWFTIQANICTPEEALQARQQQQPVVVKPLNHAYRLLVVDDNSVNLQVAQGILGKARCQVIVAKSGKEALELLASEPEFDMIFMDIQMPQMNGMMATEKAKEMLGDKCPPVIAMTAFSLQEEREEFLKAGMDDFLAKPIKAKALIGMVKRWMEPEKEDLEPLPATERASELTEIKTPKKAILPIINRQTANQLAQYGGAEMLASIYGDFATETSELIEEGRVGVKSGNWDRLKKAMHTVKGSAGTLGVEQVAEIARDLEQCIGEEEEEKVRRDFEDLENAFNVYLERYAEILNLK